jgi:cysteine desulfurase
LTRAYLDHASTSTIRPVALEAMERWADCADPGRVHTEGRMARVALEEARDSVAALLGTRSRQVIFTSGATEAINAAVFGALAATAPPSGETAGAEYARRKAPRAVVAARIEHSAVREASERYGNRIIEITVDRTGRIDVDHLRASLGDPHVVLVNCQLANHEVGTLQPVEEVVSLCRERGVMVHVDAAAGAGHVEIAFDRLGADLLSVSAHKLGGPKGIGALLVRRGLRVPPLLVGGDQERARRAGLENVPAAAGFGAAAAALAQPGALAAEAAVAARQVASLRAGASAIAGVEIYGSADPDQCLPHLLCLGVGGVEAEPVLIGLDQAGVAAHSGSSCSSEALEPSPVLEAMGLDAEHSLRLSVGWPTTDSDIALALRALPDVIARLRELMKGKT